MLCNDTHSICGEKNYEILVPVNSETLMWSEVGGKFHENKLLRK